MATKVGNSPADVQISADTTKFEKALSEVQKRLDVFTRNVVNTGAVLSAAGGAVLVPLTAATYFFASTGDAIDKMRQRTGAAAEELSALSLTAERSGASLEGIDKSAKTLMTAISEASRKGGEAAEAFATIGLNASELASLPLTQQLARIAGGMATLSNDGDKAAVAVKLLGKNGYQLVPMLKSGEQEMARLGRRAKELGVIMSRDEADAAARLTDAMTDARYAFRSLNIAIGSALEPSATAFANVTAKATAFAAALIKAHPSIVRVTAALAGLVAGSGGAILGLAGLTAGASYAAGAFKTLPKAIDQVKAALASFSTFAGIGFGKLLLLLAAVAAASYGVYKGLEALLGPADKLGKVGLEVTGANSQAVDQLSRNARDSVKPEAGGSRLDAYIDLRAREDALKRQIGRDKEAVRLAEGGGRYISPGMTGVDNPLGLPETIGRKQMEEAEQAKQRIADLNQELANVQTALGNMGAPDQWNEEFWHADDKTLAQMEKFETSLEGIRKQEEAVRQARQERSEDILLGAYADMAGSGGMAAIDEKTAAAFEREQAVRKRIAELEKEEVKAGRDKADVIQKQINLLAKELEAAQRQTDRMEEWKRKALAAVDEVRRKAGGLADQFGQLDTENRDRKQEKDFRKLLDSGRWREANETVQAGMAQLESAWAANTAAVADKLAEASAGNAEALADLEKLYVERRDLADRRTGYEGKRRDVETARDNAGKARLEVMREMDPGRFAAEFDALRKDLRGQIEAIFSRARKTETAGGDAAGDYVAADRLANRLRELESFGMNREQLAGSLLGGTFSGDAAARMNGGGGASAIARQQLDTQRKIARGIDDLNRKVEDAGGMGA